MYDKRMRESIKTDQMDLKKKKKETRRISKNDKSN